MSNNLSTVQEMYACFGQGDISGILAKFSDDVSLFNTADASIVPFAGKYKGKQEAIQYFTKLGSMTQTTKFEPSNFSEEGNKVTNEVVHDGIILSTNKPFHTAMTFHWIFNDKGEAKEWKATGDFSSLYSAFS